ncbi:MAG: N-6 DNA methylase [Anaerolineales bacterium]|nr:N-6 DNA methylase [Anaerolineales bacterium]
MIESLAPGVDASNDPRHIDCGAPDFVVERRKIPLGYVETKDVGMDLDRIEKTDQLKRYFKALNNLILTDYLEFRWYVNGTHRLTARIAIPDNKGRLVANPQGIALAGQLFTQFFQTEAPTVTSAKELATRLAEQTHLIRDLIVNALKAEDNASQAALARQYKTFCDYLLPALRPEEFADLYAQTMAYGLFAAKLSAPENAPFNRAAAYQYLTANKFLRRLFLDVGEELDGTLIAPFLDDIAALLAHADFASILSDFGKRTRTEDPVVHFYETFLSIYDPKLRESRGVYYTPEPVVQFIVHSVDWLLKNRFSRAWGLADPNVKILDPATGTATFLYYVIQTIHEEVARRGQAGTWPEKSKELLRRVFGFELLMAPYVVSHLKLGLLMHDLQAPLSQNERLQVYLTNTLEEGTTRAETIEGLGYYIAEEASQAARVKKQEDIMVVLGNPPYSNFGMLNKNVWISGLLEDYKRGLHERKINLDDDFIKFIRFAQWRIEKTGQGVLGFITNNTYIDGLTHRRMRQSLLETFDEIYILDLHGSSRKKETTPEGGKDENVFDIQQGVAILLAVKNPVGADLRVSPGADTRVRPYARVRHASLWGLRKEKYSFLQASDAGQVEWTELQPQAPDFFFVPKHKINAEEYAGLVSIVDIFPAKISGIQTGRDEFVSKISEDEFQHWIKLLADRNLPVDNFRKQVEFPGWGGFDLPSLQEKLRDPEQRSKVTTSWLYRPFDVRPILFDPTCIKRMRGNVMAQLRVPNLALITVRQLAAEGFQHVFATQYIGDGNAISLNTREYNYYFPLYLYTTLEETAGTLFAQSETTRTPNLALEFIAAFSAKLGLTFVPNGRGDIYVAPTKPTTFGPEDVFYYAYAVFHSPTYRQRYAEFLKIDFPRLPLTGDKKLFAKLAAKGEELVALHLLKSPKVDDFITSYPVAGSNAVEKVQYANGKVWINASQYFGGVPKEVREFKVGGYQVCEKWLKDRKGRALSGDDIDHYQRVVVAQKETIRLMKEIDKVIPHWPIT